MKLFFLLISLLNLASATGEIESSELQSSDIAIATGIVCMGGFVYTTLAAVGYALIKCVFMEDGIGECLKGDLEVSGLAIVSEFVCMYVSLWFYHNS